MGNLSSISSITTAASALAGLILVTPQSVQGYQPQPQPSTNGQAASQPPSLLFHYEGEQTAVLESDVTDHYIEDNTAIQDQVALKPEVITTHGFIGELNDIAPLAFPGNISVPDKLSVLGGYIPGISATALLAYEEAFFAYQTAASLVNSAVQAWGSITGNPGESVIGSTGITVTAPNQNKQQQMFQQFYGYWRSRTLFTVQTPWAIFQNMIILRLRAIQEADTNVITDFEVSFKMLRFASTQVAFQVADISDYQGRAASQASGLVNLGTQTPQTSTQSFSSALSGIA